MTIFGNFKTNHSFLCIMTIFGDFRTNHSVESSLRQNKTLECFRLTPSALASEAETGKMKK